MNKKGIILEQSRAEQSRAEQSRAEQSRALITPFYFVTLFTIFIRTLDKHLTGNQFN